MNKILITITLIAVFVAGLFLLKNKKNQTPIQNKQSLNAPNKAQQTSTFKEGELAPDIVLEDFDGTKHSLSDFLGRGMVLDFWAGWCPFCVAEMPELQKAQDKHENDLVVIGVHRTDTENISKGIEFARDLNVSYLLATDKDGSLYRATGGFGMPVAVFIDKEGIVTQIKSGPKTATEIDQKATELTK